MHRHRLGHRAMRPLAAALLVTAAACTDRANPLAPPPAGPGGTPGAPITLQALECTASRDKLTVECHAPQPGGAASADLIVGSQNVYVKVTTSNIAYNSGTGQFTFDATLQNLIEQKMGTTDGSTLDPAGVRIFFHSGPTVTGGTGVASVVPDGFGTFTAAGQPYYQYNQVLAQNATSSARTWTLIMPPTVTTFSFLLFISAPVEYPNGYITLDGQLPGVSYGSLHPASTHGLAAVVKSAVGAVIGGTVTFGTTNAGCATVDGGGVVTGVQSATCSITATSGAITGNMSFNVTGTVRSWTGATSTNWSVASNWGGGLVPAAADSVSIPFGVPNYPLLTSAVAIQGVQVADQATLSLGTFDLTANANVATGATAGSGILGTTGRLLLAGTGTVLGRVPSVLVTGTYSLAGDLVAVAPQQVDAGTLNSDRYQFSVDAQ